MRRPPGFTLLAVLAAALSIGGCAAKESSEIQIAVTEKGFEPTHFTVANGQPAMIVLTRKTDRTCATDVVFVETGQKFQLPLNKPVRVDLTGVAPGTMVHYACGMDMIKGSITLEAAK